MAAETKTTTTSTSAMRAAWPKTTIPVPKMKLEDGTTAYSNSKNVAVQIVICFLEGTGELHVATMKYGDKYKSRPEYGMYGLSSGHLERGETLVDCAAREAYEEYNLNVQELAKDGNATAYWGGAGPTSKIMHSSTTLSRRDPLFQENVGCFLFMFGWKGSSLPPIGVWSPSGAPIPYGDVDASGNFEVAEARWLPLKSVLTTTPLAHGQSGLVNATILDDIPFFRFVVEPSAPLAAALAEATATARAAREDFKKK